uniref:Uncharacterized protein n=1 Tax=Panagrolaimus superbus TaxID=310955 RepID=A0A914Z7Q6_9BILA
MISQWEPKSETMHVSNFPNGDVDFWFSVRIFDYDGSFTASDAATSPFFDNGTVFHAYSGKLLLPDDKCYESEDDGYCSVTNYAMYSSVCCKEFEYNDIPNYQKDICEEYESKSRISDENGIFATMDVLFEVALGGLNTKAVNFTSVTSDNYILGSFYAGQMCEGNKTYVDYSDPRCHFKFLSKNTQLNIGFILQYNETIIAKLIRQNGIFFKEDYTTFTPSNPCWTEFSAIPFGIGKTANNSFCCTKFKGQIFTTPSSEITSKTATFATTTISQIPSGSCALYNSTTKVLDNSAYLEVEYKLNTTTLTVNIIGYFASSDSVVQLEAYNDLTFTQSCRQSSAKILSKMGNSHCLVKFSGASKKHIFGCKLT